MMKTLKMFPTMLLKIISKLKNICDKMFQTVDK